MEYELREILLSYKYSLDRFREFLVKNGLKYDSDIEYAVGLYDSNDNLVGCGAYSQNIIKCLAVGSDMRGENLIGKIVTHLVNRLYEQRIYHLFLFTKPKNVVYFENNGFHLVECVENVALLENEKNGLTKYLKQLDKRNAQESDVIGAVVVNCNPFTRGHRYLIEYASKNCDILHVFVVEENKSVFPFDERYKMVLEGTKDLLNVVVHKSGSYIISSATFPSYFFKDNNEREAAGCYLDIKIFGKYIAKYLNITKRFVGNEPISGVTRKYNELMMEILPRYNVKVIEIKRLMYEDTIISASFVRRYIELYGVNEKLKNYIPESTYKILTSNS